MIKEKTAGYTINAALLALYPVLDIYYFGDLPIGIGTVLLLFSGLFSLFASRPNIDNKLSITWIITLLLVSVFTLIMQNSESWYSTTLWWHNTIVTVLILFVFLSSGSRVGIRVFFRIGIIIAILASIICFYQRFTQLTIGSFDKFFIPGLRMDEALELKTISRPSAFFTEPAHMCIYVIPMFYYAIVMKKPVIAVILAAGTLATGSTTGFLLLGLLLVMFMFSKTTKKRKFIYALVFLVFTFFIIKYAPNLIQENVDKFNETDTTENIRLLGGALVWRFFSFKDIVFGIGLNQLENFSQSYSLIMKNYSGALIYTFTCFGILGLISTVVFIIRLFKKQAASIGALVIFVGIFCTDQILFNRHLVYLLVFAEFMSILNIQQMLNSNLGSIKVK